MMNKRQSVYAYAARVTKWSASLFLLGGKGGTGGKGGEGRHVRSRGCKCKKRGCAPSGSLLLTG